MEHPIFKNNFLTLLTLFFLAALTLTASWLLYTNQSRHAQISAQTLDATYLNVSVYLHGIGSSGDYLNPGNSLLSNKRPFVSKTLTVYVYSIGNQLLLTKTANISYDDDKGYFKGRVNMGNTLPSGSYIIKIKVDSYLIKRVPGSQQITALSEATIPTVTLIAGDLNGDNKIDTLDYNMLMGCYSDIFPATFCDMNRLNKSDLSGDGRVNIQDYNLFLREIIVQNGD